MASFAVLHAHMLYTTNALAGTKEAAKKNVDEVVAAINGGKDAKSINANDYASYGFVFQEDGTMFVHPSLVAKKPEGGRAAGVCSHHQYLDGIPPYGFVYSPAGQYLRIMEKDRFCWLLKMDNVFF